MRVTAQRTPRITDADRVEQFLGPRRGRRGGGPGRAQPLGEEVSDAAQRIDGGARVLEDHGDLTGPQRGQLRAAHGEYVPAGDPHLTGGERAGRQQAEHTAAGHRLAGAGLADQADGLSRSDPQADPVEDRTCGLTVGQPDAEPVDLQDGRFAGGTGRSAGVVREVLLLGHVVHRSRRAIRSASPSPTMPNATTASTMQAEGARAGSIAPWRTAA